MGALDGRTAVVTGAGRGIGREIALLLGREGANVVVNDPGVNVDGSGADVGPADETVAEIEAAGGIAVANHDSVSEEAGGENMVKQAVDTWGRDDTPCKVAGLLRDRLGRTDAGRGGRGAGSGGAPEDTPCKPGLGPASWTVSATALATVSS